MFRQRHARTWLLKLSTLLLVGVSSPALAQETEADPAAEHQNLITGNPFGYVLGWYNVEYEREVRPSATLGFTASYAGPGDGHFAAGNVILRFYPQGTGLKGFYVGGRTGAFYVNDDEDLGTYFGAGLEVGYTWLMGERKNWYLGMGAGVTRLFGDVSGAVIPQVRFVNFGYAF